MAARVDAIVNKLVSAFHEPVTRPRAVFLKYLDYTETNQDLKKKKSEEELKLIVYFDLNSVAKAPISIHIILELRLYLEHLRKTTSSND